MFIRAIEVARPPGDDYAAAIPAVAQLMREGLALRAPVMILAGENGSGKSTILEAIAEAAGLNVEGGSRNARFSTGPAGSALGRCLRLVRGPIRPRDGYFLRAESLFNVYSYIDALDEEASFGPPIADSYGGASLHRRSHGEGVLDLVRNRLGGRGLYLMDEPEAGLSPSRQLELMAEIHRLVKAGSQLLLATHSPMLLAYPGAQVFWLDEAGFGEADGSVTDHFRLARRFLGDPDGVLTRLLGE